MTNFKLYTVQRGQNGYWFVSKDNDGISVNNSVYPTKKGALNLKRLLNIERKGGTKWIKS
ncbi:hypothetical protein KA025_01660 [Candidatus Saccharibacteria bacterium]|nr:hypothetical protein [Candidatus Saccharibacteria bacterium]